MPVQDSPDHSACVQHDLVRKRRPGRGVWSGALPRRGRCPRPVEGRPSRRSTTARRDDGRARYKGVLDKRLAAVDDATLKIVPKVVAAPEGNVWAKTRDEHMAPLAHDAGARP